MEMTHCNAAKTIKWNRGWLAALLLWACIVPASGVAAGAVRQAPADVRGSGSGGVLQIAAGLDHSLALKADGTVVAWGSNANGQLNVPEDLSGVVAVATREHYSLALKAGGAVVAWGNGPATVPDEAKTGVVAIAAGNKHALALKSDGEVVAWGDDTFAQATVPDEAKTDIVDIAAGALHSLALKANGKVVAWGLDNEGQSTVPLDLSDVVAIAAGAYYSMALKSNGEMVIWGDNSAGQKNVPDEAKTNIAAIAAGNLHSLALRSDGTVVAWGAVNQHQSEVPAGLNNVVAIAGGEVHSLALKADGTIVGWGYDQSGQASPSFNLNSPVRTQAVDGGYAFSLALRSDGKVVAWGANSYGATTVPAGLNDVVAVAAGGDHSLVLKSNGEVIAWGRSNEGQTTVPDAAKTNVVAIAAGYKHSLALKSNGEVVVWGDNNSGQSTVPDDAKAGVVAIAAGLAYSLALKSNGKVVAWGNGPAVPADLDHVIAIAAGDKFSLALKADGTVAAWGTFRKDSAAPPTGLTGVVAIAAGNEHALVLKLDGSIVGWGYNSEGQLSIPGSLHDSKMIYAGLNNSYALAADGTLTAWGKNSGGASDVASVSQLSGLTLDVGALVPTAVPDAYEYKYVGASVTSVRITTTLANPAAAALLVDGLAATSGSAVEVPLSSDATTTITVRIEPYLSSPARTYTVTVYKDKTFPTISFEPDGSNDWSRSAATEITVSDAGGESGVDVATLRYAWMNSEDPPSESDWGDLFANGDTLTKDGADGDWYLHARASDGAGNETIATTKIFRLDNTGPGVTVTMATYDLLAYTGDSWTNQAVYVHAEASDALSGETPLSYSMDGGLSWALYSGDLVLNSEGVHSIHIKAVDAAGNETIEQRTVKISTSGLVLTPTLTNVADGSDYTSGEWTNSSVTVSVYAQSGASGLGSLSYTLDEAPEQAYTNASPLSLDAEGEHTVVFKVSDTAGNMLDLPLEVNIDKTPPVVSFGTNGRESLAHSAATTATVSDGASGVNAATLQYKWKTTDEIEAASTSGWTSFANGSELSKDNADGDWYLHIRAQDQVGNPEYAVSNRFRLIHATSDDGGSPPIAAGTKPAIDLNGVALDPATLDLTQPVITLEVKPSEGGTAYVSLPAAILTAFADKNASLLIEINTPYGSYQVPVNLASLIPGLQALLAANHLKAEDISFKITLTDKSADAGVQSAVAEGLPRGKALGAIVDFSLEIVDAKTGRKIGAADHFSQALTRMIPMPKNMTEMPKLWGAYRYNELTKKFEFVAATKVQIEGIWYVLIRSYSNSIYLVAENAVSFTDVAKHWSEPFVGLAAAKGLVAGVGDDRYAPDRAVTRAEFTAMLVRALGRNVAIDSPIDDGKAPTTDESGVAANEGDKAADVGGAATEGSDTPGALPYIDVQPGAWYFAEAAAAKKLGLLVFASGDRFKPNQPLTREEMASMLAAAVRLEQLPVSDENASLSEYKDIGSADAAYLEDIRLMVRLGIMTGTGAHRFDPKGESTRAQAAVVFVKTLQALGLID